MKAYLVEDLEAIQYFENNLNWFHTLGIDREKTMKVLMLAKSSIFPYQLDGEGEVINRPENKIQKKIDTKLRDISCEKRKITDKSLDENSRKTAEEIDPRERQNDLLEYMKLDAIEKALREIRKED